MSGNINDAIWQACDILAKAKDLITIKNIKSKLLGLGFDIATLEYLDPDITKIISKWRMRKLSEDSATQPNSVPGFDLYKVLAIPQKDDKAVINKLQKKIFTLEFELNKYKHAACRANKKTKLLEKKLHTVLANVKRERNEFIEEIQRMLTA